MKFLMINKGLLPVYILLLLLVPTMNTWGAVSTEVIVNKSVLLNLKNSAERVSIANPAIADLVLISPRQLQINGTTVGTTSMIIWEKGNDKPSFFDLKVTGDQGIIESQIREAAPNDAVTVQYAHDTVVLSGKVANEQTRKKAEEIAKAALFLVETDFVTGETVRVDGGRHLF